MTKAEEMLNSLVETVHEHPVVDDDTTLTIDSVTRNIMDRMLSNDLNSIC